MEDKILKELDYTTEHERIVEIKHLYEKLEKKQKEFCSSFAIHCMAECGKCCEHFTPDITEAEAEFLAYGIIKEDKADLILELIRVKMASPEEQPDEFDPNARPCPLYVADSPYHCSVYKWRPLLCRLFGAAASEDKEGKPEFRRCKWNVEGHDVAPEEFAEHKKSILLMSDYGEALESLDPENTGTEMLFVKLPRAIEKLRFILSMEEKTLNESKCGGRIS